VTKPHQFSLGVKIELEIPELEAHSERLELAQETVKAFHRQLTKNEEKFAVGLLMDGLSDKELRALGITRPEPEPPYCPCCGHPLDEQEGSEQ